MPDKNKFAPLNSDQLRAIYEANPLPVVRRLLWEIFRLRVVVNHANSFIRMAVYHKSDERLDPHSKSAFNNMRSLVEAEPVVREDDARRTDEPQRR